MSIISEIIRISKVRQANLSKKKGNLLKSDKLFNKLQILYPNHKSILFNHAEVKTLLYNYEKAIEYYKKSSELSARLGLLKEVDKCIKRIEELNILIHNQKEFDDYISSIGNISNLNSQLLLLKEDLKSDASEDKIDEFYNKVENISKPIYDKIFEDLLNGTNAKIGFNAVVNIADKIQTNNIQPIYKIETLINKLSTLSQRFFITAETLFRSSLFSRDNMDISFIILPYNQTIEREIDFRIISPLRTWCLDQKIVFKTFNLKKLTLGRCPFLFKEEKVKEFIRDNFKENVSRFITKEFSNKISRLAKLRNPMFHAKKIASYNDVSEFREILLNDSFLERIAEIRTIHDL